MAQTLHNNVFTKLAASLSNSATSISLLDGSDFPTPAVGDFYFATLVSISASTGKEDDWEIVKVTGKPATNTLTVTRGQEGTAARAWDTYTPCEIRITAGTVVMPDGTQNLSNKTITSSTLDSTVVGGTTAAAGSFTDLDATTVDATNVEVTNLKAKDGTAAGSIADSTGVVSLNSAVLTTADINGGTVDGATIGQTTPALGTFTDMVADELQLTGGTGDQGTFTWNSDEDTVALVISSGESLQLGQEVEYNVRNNSGSSIAKGVPVMITGTIGSSGRITIDEMDATSVANDKKYLGITAEAIGSGADGKVMFFGKVSGLDTSSYSAGDLLFLDTSVVGGLTATEPNSGIKLGAAYVVHSHASAGVLMVRPSASVGLHDLHDVFVDAPGTGEIIRYNATSGLWETKTLAEADIATVTYVDSQITSNNELSEILATGNATGGTDIAVGTGDDITFADSSKAIFGAGSDLQIYHDGVTDDSVIVEGGAGNLVVQGDSLRLTNTSGVRYLQGNSGAEVNLWHAGSKKLETTSTGVDVTGTVTSDGLTVDGGNTLRLNAASTNDFFTITQGGTQAVLTADSDAAANMLFKTASAGVDTNRMQIFSNGDISFYEDTGTTQAFFWDASTERLGIRTTSPNAGLEVNSGTNQLVSVLRASNISTALNNGGAVVAIRNDNTTNGNMSSLFFQSSAAQGTSGILGYNLNHSTGEGALAFGTRNSSGSFAERTRINSSGTLIHKAAAVFNEDGGNSDFRVESDSNTHMLFVDAGNNKIGVGTNAPTELLEVFSETASTAIEVSSGKASTTTGESKLVLRSLHSASGTSYSRSEIASIGVAGGDSDLIFRTTSDASGPQDRFKIDSEGNIVANEAGIDANFRVEGDSNSHLLFVDGTNDRVGIGVSSPDALLHLDGTTPYIRFTRAGTPTWEIRNNNHATGYGLSFFSVTDSRQLASFQQDEAVFNEDGADIDFRVESDANANMLFVDAGNNRIGMGTNSGTGSLHIKDVKDSGGADVTVIAQNTTSNRIASYQILDESNNVTTKIQYDNGGNRGALNIQVPSLGNADVGFDGTTFLIASNSSSAALVLQSNSTDRFKLKATGEGVFNNSSNDYDFRVESNSNTHALFVDAGANATIFGKSSNAVSVDGTHIQSDGKVFVVASSNYPVAIYRSNGNGRAIGFYSGTTLAGWIEINSPSAVSINSSSDQRLKKNIADAEDAGAKVDAIQVRQFDWKADDSHQDYGMIAQELMTVAPEAVSGDPESDDMMGVDYSKLVPMLVKEIQSLRKRVAQLETN